MADLAAPEPATVAAGVAVFGLTYALLSVRRLPWLGFDRAASALLGAVACVALGVLTPHRALAAVDGATLLLLFGMMGMGAFLAVVGFFDTLEGVLLRWARTPTRLLGIVVWGSGVLAAFITNDAVCVLGAPLVVALIRRQSLPAGPFLLALATGANTGSVATLVGNPQNMLCGVLGGLSYREHLLLVGPVALLGLGINHALVWAMSRGALAATPRFTPSAAKVPLRPGAWATLGVIAASALAYMAGADLSWTATGGLVVLLLVHRLDVRQVWPRIDWALLLFFAGLFVVVEGLQATALPHALFARFPLDGGHGGVLGALRLSGIFLIGSNLVSNVPFILVVREQMATLAEPRLGWELLAMASTFAGNLTLFGSVANLIVAEAGREVGGLGFFEVLRVGVPLALLTTAVGAVWLTCFGG